MPPKENEDRYTSTPERTRIDAKGYPFLETSYPPSRFKPYFVQKTKYIQEFFFLSLDSAGNFSFLRHNSTKFKWLDWRHEIIFLEWNPF